MSERPRRAVEPRRLNRSGGISQLLLDSASLDVPSETSRRHAVNLAATAGSFARSSSGGTDARRSRPARGVVTWMVLGAAASAAIGLVGYRLTTEKPAPRAAAPLLATAAPVAAGRSLDIAAEPLAPAPTPAAVASAASPALADEARQIDDVRAALLRADPNGALSQLNEYDAAHPDGRLKPDAMLLRIEALKAAGKAAEARAVANDFRTKYPQHPLLEQVLRGLAK